MLRSPRLYLQDIRDSCEAIIEDVRGMSYDDFLRDRKTRDAVVRNIEIMGEAVKQMPQSVRDTASDVPWRDIAGMRDVMIHAYFRIDNRVVWNITHSDVPLVLGRIRELLQVPDAEWQQCLDGEEDS